MTTLSAFVKGFVCMFVATFLTILAMSFVPIIGWVYFGIAAMAFTMWHLASFVIYGILEA